MWSEIERFIKENESFLVTSHINPDGDAIGSEMALKLFLESLGKRVEVVNASPTPGSLLFLDPQSCVRVYPRDTESDFLDPHDGVFILDVNNWEHLGAIARPLQNTRLPRACIDHHQDSSDRFADVMVGDVSAAATGLLIYELIGAMGEKMTRALADALYATIVADTGTFRFSNTDARVLRAAAELVDAGAEPFDLHRRVFGSKTWGAGRLFGPVLSTLQSAADGRLAWITATQQMMNDAGANYDDTDGFIDLVRAIKGVELVLFFKETADGHVKVSLRSNGRVDAHAIASSFGGGGHKMASGMRMTGGLDDAVELVVDSCLAIDALKR